MSTNGDGSDNDSIETSVDAQGNLTVTRDFGPANAGKQVTVSFDVKPKVTGYRGSRKHVLDLLGTTEWAATLNQLIGLPEICISSNSCPIPVGHNAASETDIDSYISRYRKGVWPEAELALNQGRWWTPKGGTRPQMDLICQASIYGKAGILFVEAKAHEGELDWGGKPLEEDASDGSRSNHENICKQIAEANLGLNTICPGFALTPLSHYQLVNRLTCLWKLASSGIPVVLLYLGFTKDMYFPRDYLRDDAHWQRVMGGYMQGVVPQGFPERKHEVACGASLQLFVRSLEVTGT
jgi:hypothetical protein